MGAHNKALRFRRARGIATVACLIAGVFAWTGTASAAPPQSCTTLGGFEIDGDMNANTSNCVNGGTDWSNAGASSTTTAATYGTNNKDPQDPTGWNNGGGTPDKAGFTKVYAKTAVIGGHFDAFVGWIRPQTSGTGAYAIEIDNKSSRIGADGAPQPDRSSGGFIVYVDFQGSALPTFTKACTFTSVNDYPGTCSTNSTGYLGALNDAAITDLDGNPVAAGGFFEIALDLTQLTGITPSCPSASAASLYLRSITGNGDTNLKGYVAPFTVQPDSTCVAPPISTTANPGNSTIDGLQVTTPGSTQQDDATVGTAQAPGVGSVKFFLCGPAVVTANNGDCSANGTLVSTKTLNASGNASSDQIDGTTTPNDNASGKYCWRVEFTPSASDHNYLAGSHTNGTTECFTVAHASPTIATQIALTGSNPPGLGLTTLGDTATLTGFTGNIDNQTITFNLYGPFAGTPNCTSTAVFSTTGKLSGGSATTSQTYTPTAAGTYVWVASYGGDQLNDAVTGKCTDSNESVTIVAAHIDVTKSAKPAGPVSAGDTIGFDITVSNSGSIPALNATVTDQLPSGGDLNWTVDSYPGCSISGAVGNQTLNCSLGKVNGTTTLPAIHVSSPTTPADCGVVSNKASVKTDNGTGGDSDSATVTIQCANLTLTKTADSATVDAGQQIGFTVTATNSSAAGTGVARNVAIDDPLPGGPGVAWSIAAGGPANCAITGSAPAQTLHCTAVDLAAGQSESVHVISSTAFASCKTYDNTASLTTTNGSPLSKSASTTVQCPALTLTKTADASTVDAGAQIGFTITAQNSSAAGTGSAHGVVIDDPLPSGAGVNWTVAPGGPANCAINGTAPAQTLHCTAVDLAPGASETVHVISSTTFASCATLQNTAELTASNHPDLSKDASTRVACAKLTLSKSADAPTVNAGEQIGFTITAQNSSAAGTGTGHGVVINDPLPGGTGISWTILTGPQGCSIQTNQQTGAQTLHCTAVDLAPGDMESVHVISATAFASCAVYPNEATLAATNHPNQTADATTTVQCSSLAITKTADHGTVSAGANIGFTISVSNGGPGVAKAATLSDPLPGGSGVSWSISPSYAGPGTCAIGIVSAQQVLTCSFGDLAGGASASVHVTSATSQLSCGSYPNTAKVSAGNSPSVQDSATTTVQCAAVSIVKTADAPTVNAGEQIGFTITASNSNAAGTGTATAVVLDDPLPGGTGVNWSIQSGAQNCSITGTAPTQTLHCTAVDLGAGASESIHIVSGTAFASCATYTNTASLSGSNVFPIEDTAGTTVQCPSLTFTKTADNGTVDAGSQIGFTISANNGGPGVAKNVVIDDALPGGPGVSWSIDAAPQNCTITGTAPTQTLHCTAVDLGAGGGETIHVVSTTDFSSCATYDNTATLTVTNAPALAPAKASTAVQCASLTFTKTADNATVDAGAQIGFVVKVVNSNATGTGTAHGVTIDDLLPGGPGINWSMESGPNNCSITGTAPQQTLHCTAVDLAAGATETIHVVSSTEFGSCATYDNTATLTVTNAPAPDPAKASTTVQCASLTFTKKADDPTVNAGQQIGFTVSVSNSSAGGIGTAHDLVINDPLPGGSGVSWSIESGPQNCSITGTAPAQTLLCTKVDLGAGDSLSVHVVSATSFDSCATYANTASLTAANYPSAEKSASTVVQCPAVSIVKTADADTVNAGEKIGFTITASNGNAAGTGTATGAVIDDPLPSGSGVDWSIDSGSPFCSIQASGGKQTLHCIAINLAPGDAESVHIVSNTAFESCAVLTNVATLTGGNFPQQQDSADTTVQCPTLTLTKKADAATVDAGGQIGFTVEAANGGPGVAKGVELDDPLPAGEGVNWAIDTGPGNCAVTGDVGSQTLHCTAVDLASGENETVHVFSDTAFASCGNYDNTATLTADNAPSPNPAKASTTVECAALTITKSADDATVDAGDQIGFTITAGNSNAAGTGTAHGVVIDDPLPGGTGVDWSIASGPQNCSIDSSGGKQTLHCTSFDLVPGASLTVSVVSATEFASCATYDNTATLTATNYPTTDSNQATTTVECASLTFTKQADDPTVNAGEQIGFTVSVGNANAAGTGTAHNVVIDDQLPFGDGVSWSIESGPQNCSVTGTAPTQALICSAVDLGPGVGYSVHVVSGTSSASCATYANTATLGADNYASLVQHASTTVQCPDVSLVKTADAATVNAGQQIGFTITASNSNAAGTGAAVGVVINDPLPGGTGVDWSIESGPQICSITGTAPNQTLECTATGLAAGETESVHVVSDTAPAACGTYDNTATLTLDNGTAPDAASASTTVQCPDLAFTKTADRASVTAGAQIGFSLTASNSGAGAALGVTIIDPLPKGKGVSWSIDSTATSATGCTIESGPDGQVLNCALGDLAGGTSAMVHLVSATTIDSCATYPNAASLTASNGPELTAHASTKVTGCLGTLPTSAGPSSSHGTGPVAVTGAGPIGPELELVALLVGAGLLLLVLGRRRRRAGRHS